MRKILIAEDVHANRVILRKILREYEVLEAEDGVQAIEIMHREGADISLLLLDLDMPKLDGYQVLTRMQADPGLSAIPVIVATGMTDAAAEVKALSMGAHDFIIKPYSASVIIHRVANIIKLRETAATVNTLERDRLTGLYSREFFFEKVSAMVRAHAPGYYVMVCFDVDKFKVINDQYGTEKGDAVLRHIAGVFKKEFDPIGGICSRISGDNFAILYPASFLASDRIARIQLESAHLDGLIMPIVFSIGRYIVSDVSLQPNAMYDRASLAADSAKERYDNKIVYYDETYRERLIREQSIVTEMQDALSSGQFKVWFQPQYNHATDAMIGAEALVRWEHPTKGLIQPGTFIPLFEQNGFIYSVDKFIWEEVCRYLRKWIDAGRAPLPVSVNISRYDMLHPDIIDVLSGLVKQYALPVDLLRLEITETAFSESSRRIVDVVKELINRGFTVEIDDFGSGYSSLNTLKDVPAQIIKLDMRFLESTNSERGGNIVESIVRMAKWLGMSVIAEGVETLQQANYLLSIGCSYMQGYLYAKPMSVMQYESYCSGAEKEEHLLTLETVENLNNNTFWNPASMDTLIFNSYVGAACIFEYCNSSIELLRANRKFSNVFGDNAMSVEETLRLDWLNHLTVDSRQLVRSILQQSRETNEEYPGEYIFTDIPGCPAFVYLRATMRVIAKAGERLLVYCTCENITAQRQAEEKERRIAAQMQIIMKSINGGISAMSVDEHGVPHTIFANDKYYSMMGYTKEQMQTELPDIRMVVHPEDKAIAQASVDKLLRSHIPCENQYRCIKRDGSIIYVRTNKSITRIEGYGENVIISVLTEITDTILAERRAKQIAMQLQAILDNVDLGIVASTLQDGILRFLFANDRFYEMRGYTKEQYVREVTDPHTLLEQGIRKSVLEKTVAISQTGESTVMEYPICRRDGAQRMMRNAISIAKFEGIREPVQLSIFRDITEEKQAEQRERRAAEQMQLIMSDIDSGITATVERGGRIELLFSNDKFYSMRGYTRKQYQTEVKDRFKPIHPDDRERVHLAYTATNQKPVQIEYRYIRRTEPNAGLGSLYPAHALPA